jgi:hypothetical protein
VDRDQWHFIVQDAGGRGEKRPIEQRIKSLLKIAGRCLGLRCHWAPV